MKHVNVFMTGLLILLPCQEALAVGPTYVKDAISVSATWTKDGSPYVIQNDISVSKGAVLTIEPGTQVQFVAGTGAKLGASPNLVIQGGIRAVGSSQAPIYFTPASTGGLWGAIYF